MPSPLSKSGWAQLVLRFVSVLCEIVTVAFLIYMSAAFATTFPVSYAAACVGLAVDGIAVAALIVTRRPPRAASHHPNPWTWILALELVAAALFAAGLATLLTSYVDDPADIEVQGPARWYRYRNPIETSRLAAVVLQGMGLGWSLILAGMSCASCWGRQ